VDRAGQEPDADDFPLKRIGKASPPHGGGAFASADTAGEAALVRILAKQQNGVAFQKPKPSSSTVPSGTIAMKPKASTRRLRPK